MSVDAAPERTLPAILRAYPRLDCWLDIDRDGNVTGLTGKVEFGQGIRTALCQLIAEELDVPLERVSVASVDTSRSPDEGVTSGSRSIEESNEALRRVAAEARLVLLRAAATRLRVPVDDLAVSDGVVSARDGRSVGYGELADGKLLATEITGEAQVKRAGQYRVVGQSTPRVDLAAKVVGAAVFVQDLVLPGMLHGQIVRPPTTGSRLVGLDEDEVLALPGVRAVVRDGSFIGVVATREEQAIRALRRARRIATWAEDHENALPVGPQFLLDQPTDDIVVTERRAAGPRPAGVREFSAEYTRPYLAHASLGPSCAVAVFDGGRVTVWSHSQGPHHLRQELAKVLGLEAAAVRVIHEEGAGCYGANGADDAALDAVLLARALPGEPVRVQWMREDEGAWEPFGTPAIVRLRASLDEDGGVVDWVHELWGNGHRDRPGPDAPPDVSGLLAARHLAKPHTPAVAPRPSSPGAGGGRNAAPCYDFPNQRVVNHYVPYTPIRVSALRSLGAHANVFAIESFIDEIAATTSVDPVAYRLRYLEDPRARAVLEAVAHASDWPTRSKAHDGRGLGVGFAQYKNTGCYVAVVVEVEIGDELRLVNAWATVDAGLIVNPDGLANQVEGGILQAASWTLKEEVRFDSSKVTSTTWDTYPILQFSEVPRVHVALIDRPDEPPLGVGEAIAGPTAGAIGNAFFAATGVRLRDMPFTRERILRALR